MKLGEEDTDGISKGREVKTGGESDSEEVRKKKKKEISGERYNSNGPLILNSNRSMSLNML